MRNIIITGGELFNKGAQAMTFVAVDELKKIVERLRSMSPLYEDFVKGGEQCIVKK